MIRYSIIPPGVGPDDYEPADLEQCEEVFVFPNPGPDLGTIHAAVLGRLTPGSGAAILEMRLKGDED
ncbi:hypothetical protein ACFYWN_42415 [Streptomyces sp. NPDC002917]|uniref:hypothetical protein n=1 Tax=Streptomyces sp. NPDC002917 TaxID=3364671 RepID=UPI0036806829